MTTLPEINVQNKLNQKQQQVGHEEHLLQPQIDKSTLSHSSEVIGAFFYDGEPDEAINAEAYDVTEDSAGADTVLNTAQIN